MPHTPGPLHVRKALVLDNTGGRDFSVCDDDGAIVAEFFEHTGITPKTGELKKHPAEENAKLYATAPDLLAACELMNESIEGSYAQVRLAKLKMEAAIAKAKGQ